MKSGNFFLADGQTLARVQARLDQANTLKWVDEKIRVCHFPLL